jgi:hypothetical protein
LGLAEYRKKLDISANDAGKSIFLDVECGMSYATARKVMRNDRPEMAGQSEKLKVAATSDDARIGDASIKLQSNRT